MRYYVSRKTTGYYRNDSLKLAARCQRMLAFLLTKLQIKLSWLLFMAHVVNYLNVLQALILALKLRLVCHLQSI